jgi:hypothetical protein
VSVEWPDWVPILQEDELEFVSSTEWARSVFRDPLAQGVVRKLLDDAFREEGYLWTARAAARQWKTAMRALGYVVDACDWR